MVHSPVSCGQATYTSLFPGPVNLSPGVERALSGQDLRHRPSNGSDWLDELSGALQRVFCATTEHGIALFDGNGATAIESAIASIVALDRKILVIDNGALGERLHAIAQRYGMDIVHLRYAWGDLVDPADVEHALEQHGDIAAVVMAHHETSVGLLNPVQKIGALCRRHDVLFAVDAESSLGAEDIDVVRDHIDVCTTGADAALHSVGGVAILCIDPRVWPRIETVRARSHGLDMKRHRCDGRGETGAPVALINPVYRALQVACDELLTAGHAQRRARYRSRNGRLRRGLADLGMAPFTRSGAESSSVVICCVPAGLTALELCEGLAVRGYLIRGCSDVLADTFVQIANMGELGESDIDGVLDAVAQVMAAAAAPPEIDPSASEVQTLAESYQPAAFP